MSETDSFINEVAEEVRRDRLYGYARRFGWIPLLAVLTLVGGAAYNEYSNARTSAAAQARGDAILAALEADDSAVRQAALESIGDARNAAPIVAMLIAAEAEDAGNRAAALSALNSVIADEAAHSTYRDLAKLKHIMLTSRDTDPEERIAELQKLATPGAPFRALAEEQIAFAEIESGNPAAAAARLGALMQDTEATQRLRLRARQLIVALGQDEDPA